MFILISLHQPIVGETKVILAIEYDVVQKWNAHDFAGGSNTTRDFPVGI